MTSNVVEYALHPFAIERKNELFSDMQGGAQSSANPYNTVMAAQVTASSPKPMFALLTLATSIRTRSIVP